MSRIVLLSFALSSAVVVSALWQSNESDAYSFDWFGQPYMRDSYGNYALSDLTFNWTTWSQGWSWFSNINSYRNITSPSAGFRYDSYGAGVGADCCTGGWEGAGFYVNGYNYLHYGNTPYTIQTSLLVDLYGSVDVMFGVCRYSVCGSMVTMPSYGAMLWAWVQHYATSGQCVMRQFPQYWWC